jgi:hypothetical protein
LSGDFSAPALPGALGKSVVSSVAPPLPRDTCSGGRAGDRVREWSVNPGSRQGWGQERLGVRRLSLGRMRGTDPKCGAWDQGDGRQGGSTSDS